MCFILKSVVSGNIVFVCLFVWGLTLVHTGMIINFYVLDVL